MASQDPQAGAQLPHLPVELLARIAQHLMTHEFGEFRLSCHHIEHRTRGLFAKAFFTQKQFMVTTPSLTSLLAISRHPTFSQTLRRLSLGTDCVETPLSSTSIFDGQDMEALDAWYDQQYLINTGGWRGMVAEALRGLPNVTALDVRDYNSPTRFRDGPDGKWRSLGTVTFHETFGWWPGMIPPSNGGASDWTSCLFQNLILAASEAGTRLNRLEVILKRSGVTDSALYMVPSLAPLLENIRVLHLDVRPSGFHRQAPLYGLMAFLNATPNVTWLRLNFKVSQLATEDLLSWLAGETKGKDETDPSGETTTSIATNGAATTDADTGKGKTDKTGDKQKRPPPPSLAHLEVLEIGHGEFMYSTLTALVTQLEPTLKTLTLRRVCLVGSPLSPPTNLMAAFLMDISTRSATSNLKTMNLDLITQRASPSLSDWAVHFKSQADRNRRYTIHAGPGRHEAWARAAGDCAVQIPDYYNDGSSDQDDDEESEDPAEDEDEAEDGDGDDDE